MKKIVKKIKKEWKTNPINIIIPIISVIALIVGTLVIGLLKTLVIVVLLNLIGFLPNFLRKRKSGKKRKKGKKLLYKKVLLILLIMFIAIIIAGFGLFIYIASSAQKFDPEALYSSVPTVLYDKDNNEIAKLGNEKRVLLSYNEIPEVLIDAIIATEDSRFFQHNGVDWARFLKASAKQLIGAGGGGASTLTMQLSKNTYTSKEASGIKGIIRKFKDIYISMTQIEKNYSKEEILEFYVNSNFLGYNSYGVEQASLTYFNKSAKDLNLAEAAMIAGLFQAPGRYDPYDNVEATEKRRKTVLYLMLRHKYITEEEYNVAKELSVDKIVVPLSESSYSASGISKYQSFIDQVVKDVKANTELDPYTTSMQIYTTMDSDIQSYVTDIMNGNTYDWENELVQAGIAITNTKDGSVVALGGGRNINAEKTLNRATQIKRQIGSTAKPLYDYGPAIEYMNWSPGTPIVDEPTTYTNGPSINNWDGKFQGFINVRTALVGSRNIPALKTFKALNKADIIEFTTGLGLTPEIYSCNDGYKLNEKKCINNKDSSIAVDANVATSLHEAHSIGGYNGENPLSMAAAYAAFSNGGYYIKPYTYTKIITNGDNEELVAKIKKNKVMSEETAYLVSDMLVDTAKSALGRYSNINGNIYGAKTGTTNFDNNLLADLGLSNTNAVNDLWVVGYNTDYSMGVWYGYDDNSNLKKGIYNKLSSSQNSRLFQAIGKKIFTSKSSFTRPSGVVSVEIETESPVLCRPSKYTPSNFRKTELFVSGTEPDSNNICERFAQLDDISSLNSSVDDGKVKLTWAKVSTPKINTESYLKQYYGSIFINQSYLNSFVSNRLSYINNYMGSIGYSIYEKTNSGLTLLDFTTNNTYEIIPKESGSHTYVVKTSYSIFKGNMSNGKSCKISVEINNNTTSNPTTPTA